MKYYKVDEETLVNLLKRDTELEALECGGVDNWGFYGESFYMFAEDMGFNRAKEDLETFFTNNAIADLKRFKEI